MIINYYIRKNISGTDPLFTKVSRYKIIVKNSVAAMEVCLLL